MESARCTSICPHGLALDILPAAVNKPLSHWADYKAHYLSSKNGFDEQRALAVGNTLSKVEDYPQLRAFFQKIGAQDQNQVILIASPPADRATSASAPD